MIKNSVSTFIAFLMMFNFINTNNAHDSNGYGYSQECETVHTTKTVYDHTVSTFVYTKTDVVPAGTANMVTKYVEKPISLFIITSTLTGVTKVITIATTTTIYYGATTTTTSTVTETTFPYATTSITNTEYLVKTIKGTLTVTYPAPIITLNSNSRYTGAPTSLWLSVI